LIVRREIGRKRFFDPTLRLPGRSGDGPLRVDRCRHRAFAQSNPASSVTTFPSLIRRTGLDKDSPELLEPAQSSGKYLAGGGETGVVAVAFAGVGGMGTPSSVVLGPSGDSSLTCPRTGSTAQSRGGWTCDASTCIRARRSRDRSVPEGVPEHVRRSSAIRLRISFEYDLRWQPETEVGPVALQNSTVRAGNAWRRLPASKLTLSAALRELRGRAIRRLRGRWGFATRSRRWPGARRTAAAYLQLSFAPERFQSTEP